MFCKVTLRFWVRVTKDKLYKKAKNFLKKYSLLYSQKFTYFHWSESLEFEQESHELFLLSSFAQDSKSNIHMKTSRELQHSIWHFVSKKSYFLTYQDSFLKPIPTRSV